MQIGALSHGVAFGIVLQKINHASRDRSGVIEWNNHTSPLGKNFLSMPVRRGDDRLSGAERNGQGSGNHLGLLPVGSDVDICRADVFDQFLSAHEAVIKNHLCRDSQLFCEVMQTLAIALAFMPENMWMSDTGNDVNHVRMLFKN